MSDRVEENGKCRAVYVRRESAIIQFLPCNAILKRGICCRPVSIHLSVRHVGRLYPDAEDTITLHCRPSTPTTLAF